MSASSSCCTSNAVYNHLGPIPQWRLTKKLTVTLLPHSWACRLRRIWLSQGKMWAIKVNDIWIPENRGNWLISASLTALWHTLIIAYSWNSAKWFLKKSGGSVTWEHHKCVQYLFRWKWHISDALHWQYYISSRNRCDHDVYHCLQSAGFYWEAKETDTSRQQVRFTELICFLK